jgi:hypothetical protein
MKTQTKVLDLQKLLAIKTAEKEETATRQAAQRLLDNVIKGQTPSDEVNPETIKAARSARATADTARITFAALPKARREMTEAVRAAAKEIAQKAAMKMGGSYSGDTSQKVVWGTAAKAYTVTDQGDQYSRSCTYKKTDATHHVTLDPARVHSLVESERLRELSSRDGLPLIALDADGGATWIKSSGKQIAAEHGWIIGCSRCCYHSTTSKEAAVKGHAKKLAAILENDRQQAEREKARKASPEYKAERRARLIARLCGGATATVEDARACGYCLPGIEQFQRAHGIGNSASLPALVKTGNSMAVSLALRLARKVAKAA